MTMKNKNIINDIDDVDSDEETPIARKPFPFFALPYELRLRIYELALQRPSTIDLDPTNIRALRPSLDLFLVSHRTHDEASRVFYSGNTFRIFPIHGRFFHTKNALLTRIPSRYRQMMSKLELRVGPGWTKPPRCWVVDEKLGLHDMSRVRHLRVFVECDPASHPCFEGFGNGDDFYTRFCVDLVKSVAARVPTLADVEFDAYPGIDRDSPLLNALVDEAEAQKKRVLWGPERGWDGLDEAEQAEMSLVAVMEKLRVGRTFQGPEGETFLQNMFTTVLGGVEAS